VGRWGRLGLAGLAAVLLHAQEPLDYNVRVPGAGVVSRIEWHVEAGSRGVWDVSVTFDAAQCSVHCAYHRKRDAAGRTPLADLMAPPITAIRVYRDSMSNPTVVTVDPAGLQTPAMTRGPAVAQQEPCLPGKSFTIFLVEADDAEPSPLVRPFAAADGGPERTLTATAPLRI
jgi:hypothetical protein